MSSAPGLSQQAAIIKQTKSLFDKPDFSDCVIKGANHTYHVHKAIICCNHFFAGAFSPSSVFTEAKDGSINMEMDDPYALKVFLMHLYGYIFPEGSGGEAAKDVSKAIKVYTIADKYTEMDLKPLVCGRIFQYYARCETFNSQDFASHVIEGYEATVESDKILRGHFVDVASRYKIELFSSQSKDTTTELFATCS